MFCPINKATFHKGIIKCFRKSFKWGMFSYSAVKDGKASPKANNFILSPGTRKNSEFIKICSLALLKIKLISNKS